MSQLEKVCKGPKITAILTTEEMVLNPKYKGLRTCRIEVWTDRPGQDFHYEVGRIEVSKDDELFDAIREAIHRGLDNHKPKEEIGV